MSEYNHLDLVDPTIVTYPGSPHQMGAYYNGHGINFALYAAGATKVQLCLFRKSPDEQQEYVEYARINVQGKVCIFCFTVNVWLLSMDQDVLFD